MIHKTLGHYLVVEKIGAGLDLLRDVVSPIPVPNPVDQGAMMRDCLRRVAHEVSDCKADCEKRHPGCNVGGTPETLRI